MQSIWVLSSFAVISVGIFVFFQLQTEPVQNSADQNNMSFITVTFIRHGETEYNRQHLVQGYSDLDLNEQGIKQANLIGKNLANEKFTRIYSSDMKRAEQTCEIIHKHLEQPAPELQLDPKLREKDFGEWEGKPSKDMMAAAIAKQSGPVTNWVDLMHDIGGEPHDQVVNRARGFIEKLFKLCDAGNNNEDDGKKENVLVVSHGMQIITMLLYLNSSRDMFNFENFSTRGLLAGGQPNTAKTIIRIHMLENQNDIRRVEALLLTDGSHLRE